LNRRSHRVDARGRLTVSEIITLVKMGLGNAEPTACAQGIPAGATVDFSGPGSAGINGARLHRLRRRQGVYRAGRHQRLDKRRPALPISTLAVDPLTPTTLYAVAADGLFNGMERARPGAPQA
jgi:hypothetical protein